MNEDNFVDYDSTHRPLATRKGCRDYGILLAAFACLIGCWALGTCIRFDTGLNYIDGGENHPVTPGDQLNFEIAAILPYVGWGLFALAFGVLVILKAREEWWGRKPPAKQPHDRGGDV